MILITILILLAILLGLCFVYWRRNDAVYAFRVTLIDDIYRLSMNDLTPDWWWRYEEFDSVSYDEMFWRPWRPLSSFYREGFPLTKEPARSK